MRCVGCAKVRQKCLYLSSDATSGGAKVGKVQDAAEDSEEEAEEEEEEEEEKEEEEKEKKRALPIIKVL